MAGDHQGKQFLPSNADPGLSQLLVCLPATLKPLEAKYPPKTERARGIGVKQKGIRVDPQGG